MTHCELQQPKSAQRTQKTHDGLYQPDYEHDACGVGMVVNIHGGKSHELVGWKTWSTVAQRHETRLATVLVS